MKIIFNGIEIELNCTNLSYEEISKMIGCNPDSIPTVTYSRGRNQVSGSLTRGQFVELSERMVINASLTNNA